MYTEKEWRGLAAMTWDPEEYEVCMWALRIIHPPEVGEVQVPDFEEVTDYMPENFWKCVHRFGAMWLEEHRATKAGRRPMAVDQMWQIEQHRAYYRKRAWRYLLNGYFWKALDAFWEARNGLPQ